MSRLFLTGGTGFLGGRLLQALQRRGSDSIIALDRSGSLHGRQREASPGGLEIVRADLLNPKDYQTELAKAEVVIHLAAMTGRASEADHLRVNLQGTEVLLDQCRRLGVHRFLFVSSIAAKFPDKTRYYYAQAKLRAEEAVRSSGLRFSIIRPTIILGSGSPILTALDKLAGLPVIPVFGDGRAMVQPIYADDVVDFILSILDQNLFSGDTLELGGPATLTMEELIQEIRYLRKGAKGRSIHVPMSLLVTLLRSFETAGLGHLLPLSVGQLSPFRYNSTIESNPLFESRRDELRSVSQMLALSFAA